jgi:hypothetical protein
MSTITTPRPNTWLALVMKPGGAFRRRLAGVSPRNSASTAIPLDYLSREASDCNFLAVMEEEGGVR